MKWLCALAFMLSTAGCAPDLTALTNPPPGRVASIDNQDDFIELSRGVALAFECVGCNDPSISVDDESIAELRGAYLTELQDSWSATPLDRTGYVLLGMLPGTTKLHVKLPDRENAEYRVTVLDD